MYVVTVTFVIEPSHLEQFMPLMIENARLSLKHEPGCARFDVCQDPARPSTVFLYEIYVDRAAFEAHLRTEHFMQFDWAVRNMVEEKHVRAYTLLTH
jgi:(4S)-4-hydroxy-5-phosphonooxypentane-2,3-dione isomerase